MLKQIEIDVDGVLANMDGSYGGYIKDIIPDFSEEKYIKEWDMPQIAAEYPEAYKRIQNLWTNPTFIYNLPRYPLVVEGVKELYNISKNKAEMVVHTHIKNKGEVSDSRRVWLEDLREETMADFMIEISTGQSKKTRENSYIVIEDNVNNLKNSSAKYKILVRRGHNRNYNETDLGDCIESFVVNSFYDAVAIIERILN